jgi:hypothetical protein
MDTVIPNSALDKASSDMECDMTNKDSNSPLMSVPDRSAAAATAGYESLGATAAATAADEDMLTAMQRAAAAASGAKKRKRPLADGAAGAGSKPGSRKGKGPATKEKLVPGLCHFCGQDFAPW